MIAFSMVSHKNGSPRRINLTVHEKSVVVLSWTSLYTSVKWYGWNVSMKNSVVFIAME